MGLPLSRLSVADVARHARQSGLVARISDSTVWRWLHEDAIRPWQHRCWIFPRDPHFQAKAGRILDLYERCWQGQRLREDEFVISIDGKTGIQARLRIHPSLPTEPGKPMRVEHEYARGGACTCLAALDVHRARVFGRCEATTGIAPFGRLVDQVMSQPPYNTARRVFWVMDNGSSHRGEASVRRLTQAHPRVVPVHGPRELAQPDRNLFLDRPAQGTHAQRLPLPGGGRRAAGELRALLREHRPPIRVEVHPR
ncbi:MAG: transposase [Candidatus Thermoplasmatota archaeon]|nr:transposase [Candidatus Thermoplasmatota archaeon]